MSKGHHEPREKRDRGKPLCPNWVRSEMDKLMNGLDGTHDEVMVGAVAIMGPNGYDFDCVEQTTNFDPMEYGPMMHQGYAMIAGAGLAQLMRSVHEATKHPDHFSNQIEDPDERLQQLRNLYEQAIRQFLDAMFTYAGGEFQHDQAAGPSIVAGSQLLNLWLRIAASTITFKSPGEGGTPDDSQR